MTAKKIATSISAQQYQALERQRRRLKLKRSEVVQLALKLWLSTQRTDAKVAQYIRAYTRHPEDQKDAKAMVAAWAEGQSAEDWS
jgi:metal-responsive CopG/Arc/MetJ family transcriptional regulator